MLVRTWGCSSERQKKNVWFHGIHQKMGFEAGTEGCRGKGMNSTAPNNSDPAIPNFFFWWHLISLIHSFITKLTWKQFPNISFFPPQRDLDFLPARLPYGSWILPGKSLRKSAFSLEIRAWNHGIKTLEAWRGSLKGILTGCYRKKVGKGPSSTIKHGLNPAPAHGNRIILPLAPQAVPCHEK